MRIIVNADDFGWDDDTVDATVEGLVDGWLTSATIMVNLPAAARALDFARRRPDLAFGLHLVLVSDGPERPVSPPESIPGLLGGNRTFPSSNDVRLRALAGRLPAAELDREISAQLLVLREAGIRPSHVDSHGHLHKFGPVRRALSRVLAGAGLARVRSAQDVYLRPNLRSPTFWLGPIWRRRLRASFRTTDRLYLPAGASDRGWPSRLLPRVGAANTLEVGVHPGTSEGWRRDEAASAREFTARARAEGHSLIGWNDL